MQSTALTLAQAKYMAIPEIAAINIKIFRMPIESETKLRNQQQPRSGIISGGTELFVSLL
jgi:hypothetical protein